MSTTLRIAIIAAAAALTGVGVGYLVFHGGGAAPRSASTDLSGPPSTRVSTDALTKRELTETLVVYGTVVAAPGELQTFSAGFESRVEQVLVVQGQQVAKDTPLMVLAPSADATLEIRRAEVELEAARAAAAATREKLGLGLATRPDLEQAVERVSLAEKQLSSLRGRGAGGKQQLRAEKPGVVGRLLVEPGQIVPTGANLIEVVDDDRLSVLFGVEAEDVDLVAEGDRMTLSPLGHSPGAVFDAEVKTIARRVNPSTRLVDVSATTRAASHLMLNEFVVGRIAVSQHDALAVPRAAIVYAAAGPRIYTLDNGVARAHDVEIGIETADYVEVVGTGLSGGQLVVTSGQAYLSDGAPAVDTSSVQP